MGRIDAVIELIRVERVEFETEVELFELKDSRMRRSEESSSEASIAVSFHGVWVVVSLLAVVDFTSESDGIDGGRSSDSRAFLSDCSLTVVRQLSFKAHAPSVWSLTSLFVLPIPRFLLCSARFLDWACALLVSLLVEHLP